MAPLCGILLGGRGEAQPAQREWLLSLFGPSCPGCPGWASRSSRCFGSRGSPPCPPIPFLVSLWLPLLAAPVAQLREKKGPSVIPHCHTPPRVILLYS